MGFINEAECLPHLFGVLGVVPVMVGPLNALVAAAPGILLALGGLAVTLFKPRTIKRLLQLLWSQKWALLVVIAAIVGICYGVGALFPHRPGAVSAAIGADKTSWPAYRGGADRRAFSGRDFSRGKDVDDPAHGKINWAFTDGSIETFYSSAAAVGNRIYITGSRYSGTSDIGGIYCIDADTGKLVWAFHGDHYRSTFSSPAVWGKYLVVGEGLHETMDSRIFCIDIAASEKAHQGVKLWDYRTTSHMESSPCIDTVNRTAIVGGADDGVYCFKLDPGPGGKAQKVWQLPAKDYPDCETSPVVVGDKVYFGLGREIHAMCCADAKTGKPIWRVPTPYSTSSPAVAGGKLYFGMGVGDFVNSAGDLRARKEKELQEQGKSQQEIDAALQPLGDAGEVWCIDLATHQVAWKVNAGETILGTPAVDGDRVYFGAYNGMVFCVSTDGPDKFLRTFNVHEPIVSGPAVGNHHVYISTLDGTLYALDKMSLARVWRVPLNKGTFSSPTVADGHVYLGTTDGGFLCLGVPGSEPEEPLWPGAMGGAAGSVDASLIVPAASYAWGSETAAPEGDDAPVPTAVTSAAAVIGHSFYVGAQRNGANGVAAFDCAEDLSKKPAAGWFAAAKNPVTISPAANERCVYYADGKPGDGGRALHCVDRKTGATLWTHPIEKTASGQFTITPTQLFIADSTSDLTCINIAPDAPRNAAGELWHAIVGDCIGAPAVGDDLLAVAVKFPPQLVALDRHTHQRLWSQPLSPVSPDLTPQTSPVISHDRVWIGDAHGVHGYSLLHNVPPRFVNCGSVSSAIAADADRLACITDAGRLVVINADTGAADPIIDAANPAVPPILADNALLYDTAGAINLLDLRTHQPAFWARVTPTFPGVITTSMIMVNSHVFFGTDKRGLVCMKPRKH